MDCALSEGIPIDDPLAEAELKVKRANKRIRKLDVRIHNFLQAKPYRAIAEVNAEGTEQIVRLFFDEIPDDIPEETMIVLGHLRSALDYLAWAVAHRFGPPANPKTVYFPIAETREKYESPGYQGTIKQLGSDWLAFVSSMKPYPGGSDLLCALNIAINRDKHRTIVRVQAAKPDGIAHKNLSLGHDIVVRNGVGAGPLVNGMEIASYAVGVHPNHEVHFSTQVAFCDIDFIENEPVVSALRQFSQMVKSILKDARRALFP